MKNIKIHFNIIIQNGLKIKYNRQKSKRVKTERQY